MEPNGFPKIIQVSSQKILGPILSFKVNIMIWIQKKKDHPAAEGVRKSSKAIEKAIAIEKAFERAE